MITGSVNVEDFYQKLLRLSPEVERLTDEAVHRTGARIQTQVRANASSATHPRYIKVEGRKRRKRAPRPRGHLPGTGPGPNVATGDYRRSIALIKETSITGATAIIGTNAPQAMRLEYGFTGTDSLGRNYKQPPYPHWRPAVEKAPEFLEKEIKRAIRLALKATK